jgi:hypothetical protein
MWHTTHQVRLALAVQIAWHTTTTKNYRARIIVQGLHGTVYRWGAVVDMQKPQCGISAKNRGAALRRGATPQSRTAAKYRGAVPWCRTAALHHGAAPRHHAAARFRGAEQRSDALQQRSTASMCVFAVHRKDLNAMCLHLSPQWHGILQ